MVEPFQVPRLGPGVEERLLALLRIRILPVAQKSLRLWSKGDMRCPGVTCAVRRNAVCHACVRARTCMLSAACVALLLASCLHVTQRRQQQARLLPPGQGHIGAARHAMDVTTGILCCNALQHSLSEEERLRAVRHVCSALPRTARELPEQVRPLSSAWPDRRTCTQTEW